MRKIPRNPAKFDLIKIINQFALSSGFNLTDESCQQEILTALAKQIEANRKNKILLHGRRIQEMFGYVVGAMDSCSVIKEEDSGEIYCSNIVVSPPDYRIIAKNENHFLVEVKNFYSRKYDDKFKINKHNFKKLLSYAKVMKIDLYMAIFWARFKLWTLLSPNYFKCKGNSYSVSFLDAIKFNCMSMLGDVFIGTTPPLVLKFITDPSKPRSINPDGRASFTIGDVEIYGGGKLIKDSFEKKLAWFFMNYGKWPVQELPAEVHDGNLISLSFSFEPEERANPSQRFEFIGTLSEMISSQFDEFTAPDGSINCLNPNRDPSALGISIPSDFKGKDLSLWRFNLSPKE